MSAAPLVYSDAVPTVPGWYWRRDASGQGIVRLTQDHNPPRHWREAKAATLETVNGPGFTQQDRDTLAARPDASWLIEWAGPIQPPR